MPIMPVMLKLTKHTHCVSNVLTDLIHVVSWQLWSQQLKHPVRPVSHRHPSVSHSQYHQPYSTLQLPSRDEYCSIRMLHTYNGNPHTCTCNTRIQAALSVVVKFSQPQQLISYANTFVTLAEIICWELIIIINGKHEHTQWERKKDDNRVNSRGETFLARAQCILARTSTTHRSAHYSSTHRSSSTSITHCSGVLSLARISSVRWKMSMWSGMGRSLSLMEVNKVDLPA